MSQNYNTPAAADTLAASRIKYNDSMDALRSVHSGATAPSSTIAHMLWVDTATGWVKQRNAGDSAWLYRWPIGSGGAGIVQTTTTWLHSGNTNPTLVTIPAHHRVLDAYLFVTEAFSPATNLIVGHSADTDAYVQSINLALGQLVTLGAERGDYSSVARAVVASLNTSPSAGKALLSLTFEMVEPSP